MKPASLLKIGFVLDTSLDPPDGVQQYVVSVGEWLRSQGHDVHYVVGETKRTDLPNIHSLARNIQVLFNGNRTTIPLPASRRKLKNFLQAQQFDILHVQTPHSPFFAQRLILAASAETAIVATFHVLPDGWLPAIGNRLLGLWLRPSLKRIDAMLSVSDAAAAFARKTFHLNSDVLPNVFDHKLFHEARPLPQYDDDRLTILFLGRLVPRKGCLLLLQAIALLKDRTDLPPYRVVVCGRGALERTLKDFVRRHDLENIVEFTGFVSVEDKPRYYASADIAVFPSRAGESFGIVLLEALASGKAAVLGGDNPGYRSVLSPRPDLLFNPKSSQQLAAKLVELLQNATLRSEQAAWGESYTIRFDVNHVGAELVNRYNHILHQRAKMR